LPAILSALHSGSKAVLPQEDFPLAASNPQPGSPNGSRNFHGERLPIHFWAGRNRFQYHAVRLVAVSFDGVNLLDAV
jgi:hypothetical protein